MGRSPVRHPLLLLAALLLGAARGAGAQEAVPLAARDLPRGTVLEAADVRFADGAASPAAGAPLGWVTRRVVEEGEPLRAPTVAPPQRVRAGDTVQLLWSGGAVRLRVTGRAMGGGALGERVWVRLDSRRRFAGVVVGEGLVEMRSPERNRS